MHNDIAEIRAKNAAMLDSIGDGVVGVSDGGEITFVNHQAQEMLGYQESELVGKMLVHAIPLKDESGNFVDINKRPIHEALLTSKKITSRDYSFVKRDGGVLPVWITVTPVLLSGRLIGGVTVFRDITKEKEVDRMKTEFISLASHQLRTPLSAIKWRTEMLVDGDAGQLNPQQMDVAKSIYQSNERMIDLVNALLNISRIESGRIIIDPKPTDLAKLVSEVVEDLGPKISEKRVKLVVSVNHDLPIINVDPKLVRHVYMNLLTNSIKYSPEGSQIMIVISKTESEVVSQVTDSGYGIPVTQQDRVFERFFRANNIVKKVTDGTGLGLYLVRAIVESSGGKIWFKSEENKGTTFWFSLPLLGSKPKEGEVSIDG